MRVSISIIFSILMIISVSCGPDENSEEQDSCRDVTCSGHGSCSATGGAASCDCDEGYHPEALTCEEDAQMECAPVNPNCVAGRSYDYCCLGYDCEFHFEDGTVLSGLSAAVGYCTGENEGSEDGNCSGIATPCSSAADEMSCNVMVGCSWLSVIEACSGSPSCILEYAPSDCNDIDGCYWSEPDPAPDPGCTSMTQGCVEGRRFRVCGVSQDDCEHRFEDGTILQGSGAAMGYCRGETDGSEDGNCEGTATPCYSASDEASCVEMVDCSWLDAISACSGSTPSCLLRYTPADCNEIDGCYWVSP